MDLFLSRLNSVSVFHYLKASESKNEAVVSIPPKSGLSFSPFEGIPVGSYDICIVSIPPKSGLSFSLILFLMNSQLNIMFLSRLNPVSVFHGLQEPVSPTALMVFLSRLNPVSVFHFLKERKKIMPKRVSIPPKSGLSFSRRNGFLFSNHFSFVSIPPKSGLSFSRGHD